MVFDQIEKVKGQYTDKYVVVDADRPELARFRDIVGQVKTINMSGRALVEFSDYHLNIGWYDIDLDYLKVVDKPAPKPKEAAKKPAAKPAAKKPAAASGDKKLSPLEMARQQGAAGKGGKAPTGDKPSTADILAAARGGKAAAPATKEKPPAGGKMSTADILAAARGGKSAAEESSAEEVVEEAVVEEAPAEAAAPASSGEKVDRSSMTVDDMIAWCREHDAS